MLRIFRSFFPAAFIALAIAAPVHAAPPSVVATIKPFHSLTAAVMDGVGTPHLLLQGNASPHGYALRPSDIATLNKADLIVWVGPMLEGFLEKPLHSLPDKGRLLTIEEINGIRILDARPLERADRDSHDHGSDAQDHDAHDDHEHDDQTHEGHDTHDHDGHDHGTIDAHLWLSVANAKVFVTALQERLVALDPANADAYRANAARTLERLEALHQRITETVKDVRTRPFITFHDAYQYFEKAYGLKGEGAITLHPDQPPSAKHLRDIRALLQDKQVACVFQEPQFPTKTAQTVLEGSSARLGILDPLGASLADGPDLYFAMMTALADELRRCLTP